MTTSVDFDEFIQAKVVVDADAYTDARQLNIGWQAWCSEHKVDSTNFHLMFRKFCDGRGMKMNAVISGYSIRGVERTLINDKFVLVTLRGLPVSFGAPRVDPELSPDELAIVCVRGVDSFFEMLEQDDDMLIPAIALDAAYKVMCVEGGIPTLLGNRDLFELLKVRGFGEKTIDRVPHFACRFL